MIKRYYSKTLLFYFITCWLFMVPDANAQDLAIKEYSIGPGDVVSIQVWDHNDLNRKVEISQEGGFTFPLVGKIQAAGLSVFELEKVVTDKLAAGYLISPQVTVSIAEFRNQEVFLFGAVKEPGSYVVKGKTHILKLTTDAGGFVDETGMSATIIRPASFLEKNKPVAMEEAGDHDIITIDLNQVTVSSKEDKFYVWPGDSVYINKMARLFVTGEVKNPGKYAWEKDLTVREAISLAGGPSTRGAPERATIVRTENGVEKEITPEMGDVVLADDIINVPKSYF
jgi:polysaccharide biosynthesis/export protein